MFATLLGKLSSSCERARLMKPFLVALCSPLLCDQINRRRAPSSLIRNNCSSLTANQADCAIRYFVYAKTIKSLRLSFASHMDFDYVDMFFNFTSIHYALSHVDYLADDINRSDCRSLIFARCVRLEEDTFATWANDRTFLQLFVYISYLEFNIISNKNLKEEKQVRQLKKQDNSI